MSEKREKGEDRGIGERKEENVKTGGEEKERIGKKEENRKCC